MYVNNVNSISNQNYKPNKNVTFGYKVPFHEDTLKEYPYTSEAVKSFEDKRFNAKK